MFSVIIATRDRLGVLPRTLDALEAQSQAPRELIIVDDGSADGTPEFLAASGHGATVIRTSGIGVAAARNVGLSAASSIYVIFLDDDDVPSTTWLETMGALTGPDVAIASCAVTIDSPEGSELRQPPDGGSNALFLTGAFAVRRDLIDAVGGFTEGLTFAENTELALRLAPLITERHLTTRTTNESLLLVNRPTSRRSSANRSAAILRVLELHSQTFAADSRRLAQWLTIASVDAWKGGDHGLGRALSRRALRARPAQLDLWIRVVATHVPVLARRRWKP